ncbi:hypothetical protein HU764_004685 [Pseudomonas sp. SWRI100]|uniref:hypothetical protein n=1 Tax=Pseudomonas TaxID=286 RepID=UPI0016488202|nr:MULTISPECIES: hypothetical protein [Pseudomonas]MBC3496149.1 hypothetical protein [Pseudomonas sp. SWRI67]MBV4525399.1 hypothetical protein [Pseudomonas kermanshahensis]
MKTVRTIADEAYNDILCLQARLEDARTLFRSISKIAEESSLPTKLALMGDELCEEWVNHADDWMKRMDASFTEIDAGRAAAPQKPAAAKRGAGGAA